MVKLDLEFTFFKKFALGGTLTYYSAMRNVDKFMFELDANNPTSGPETQKNLKQFGDLPFYNFYNAAQLPRSTTLVGKMRWV